MTTVLETVHGSRLYGLSRDGSDFDTYVVTDDLVRGSRQHIEGSSDVTTVSLGSFSAAIAKGVPQAVEALYSSQKTVQGPYSAYVSSLRPGIDTMRSTYTRTIKSFWLRGDVKGRRHAVRLMLNLDDFVRFGQFDPTLKPDDAMMVKTWSHHNDWEFIENASRAAALGRLV